MNTYNPENPNGMQGGENGKETDSAEDLFLPGGFDSFGGTPEPMNGGLGQMNSNMGQLGSVDYGNGYGTAYNNTNRRRTLSFKEQISNSFKPSEYIRYNGMSEGEAKEFVKNFTKLYIKISYLIIAFMMLVSFMGMGSNVGILIIVVALGISYALSLLLEQYMFRLRAFIYRVIFGSLLTAVTKANISSTNMYLVSIYACVPCMAIAVLMTGVVVLVYLISPMLLYPLAAVSSVISIIQLIIPIVIMGIAIPRME